MTPLELATQELERCRDLLAQVDHELRTEGVTTNTWSKVIVETVCISGLLAGLAALEDVTK